MAEEQKQHPVDLYALVRGAFDAHAKVVTLASTLLAMSDAKLRDNAAMGEMLSKMMSDQASELREAREGNGKLIVTVGRLEATIAERDGRIASHEKVHALQVDQMKRDEAVIEERDKRIEALERKRALDPLNKVVEAARVYVVNRKHDGRDKHLNALVECVRALDMVESEDAPDRVDAAVG